MVLEALLRYAHVAQSSIAGRWQNAVKYIRTQRSIEASELVGFDVHHNNLPFMYLNTPKAAQGEVPSMKNRHFYVPHKVSDVFTGQARLHIALRRKMLPNDQACSLPQRRFVCYGLGGGGKSQFCLKFVHDHRDR